MRLSRRAGGLLMIGPALAMILVFMVLPLLLMGYVSLLERGEYGGVEWQSFSGDSYAAFLFERGLDGTRALNTAYLEIFTRSFLLSLSTMVIAVLVGFPTALYMSLQSPRWRNVLVFLVTIPFWTNLLVRNYAWILLLRDTGLINTSLLDTGLITEPLPLIYNDFSVAVGLTYSFLPFMVLPIYASLEKLDWRLVEAAYDLYASRWRALRHVILPLTRPGIVAGCVLVFVPCLGAYVTPVLLGGGKAMMIGNLIQLQFGASRNWPFGAALAFALLVIVLLSMTVYALRTRRATAER